MCAVSIHVVNVDVHQCNIRSTKGVLLSNRIKYIWTRTTRKTLNVYHIYTGTAQPTRAVIVACSYRDVYFCVVDYLNAVILPTL